MKQTYLLIALLFPTIPAAADTLCEGLKATKNITADAKDQSYDGTKNDDVIVIKKLKKSVWLYLSGGKDIVCIEGISESEGQLTVRSIGEHSITVLGENFSRFNVHKDRNSLKEKGKLSVTLKNIQYADIDGFIENDKIDVEIDEGYIYAGSGSDTITATGNELGIYGEEGSDRITAIAKSDNAKIFINGGDGNDSISGSELEDFIIGGSGSDQIWGNDGNDLLIGGDAGSTNNDYFGDGFYLYGNEPITDIFYDNKIVFRHDASGGGIYGGDGDDVIIGSDGNEALEGGSGKDYIEGRGGMDGIFLGETALNGTGEIYKWTLKDGSKSGSFSIRTIPDNDGGYANGGDGDDEIWGSDAADELVGGKGNDKLYSMEGNDYLSMGTCNDTDYGFGMGGNTSWSACKGDYVIPLKASGFKVK